MAPTPPIKNITIVGVTGRIGGAFATELAKSDKHIITGFTRKESKGQWPEGVKRVEVDYDNDETLVEALKGQQLLIITLSVRAPPDLHDRLVKAAVKASVPYVMPNAYGFDPENENLQKEPYTGRVSKLVHDVKDLGANYIAICCGYWYEWSLALGEQWFGFDIKNRTVTFFDDGKTKICSSTWDQCGRAVAGLLALPESGATPAFEDWRNKVLYFNSFVVCQRDMLDSLHRVLGTTDKDWTITYEPTDKRYKDALADQTIMTNFAKAIYSRIFFPVGDGEYSKTRPLVNDEFGLPKEDLDACTKRAVDMVESGWTPFA